MKEQIAQLLAAPVADEVTEAYDSVESLLGRISVERIPELAGHLERAKAALWEARMVADEAAGRGT